MIGKAEPLIEKLETGIPGFDLISNGGVPKNRVTLVSGTAGSAKTVFAAQFLAEGIKKGEPGLFLTFEESIEDLRKNMGGFGWEVEKWEAEGMWTFIDASLQPNAEPIIAGSYDLGALLARINYAVEKHGAKRVSIDSVGAIFTQFSDSAIVRRELLRITAALKKMGVTVIITAECTQDYGDITRYGVEEFVADNVVILRNVLEDEKRRRTIEILKFRGTNHQKGEYPFTVISQGGIIIIPISAIELKQKSSAIRISSGNDELDKMCGGGLFRNSVILISGATGTGKTLMTSEFIKGGVNNGERCLLFAFEESQEQFFRNATGWGMNLERMESEGKLKIVCEYPESAVLEDHLINIKTIIEDFKPNRVAIDSLSALERGATIKGFREFVISLTSFIKHLEIAGLFTATSANLMGGASVTESHISTITDSIILLKYVEMYGEMKRGLTVLKMRGSMHNKDIREFTIDDHGMHIGQPFRSIHGILTGNLQHIDPGQLDRVDKMFK
jgi:circadian clock protein KaiC